MACGQILLVGGAACIIIADWVWGNIAFRRIGKEGKISAHGLCSQGRKANVNYRITASLFCAGIERTTLKISLIMIKTNVCWLSAIYADKEATHGMGSQIKSKHKLYWGTLDRRNWLWTAWADCLLLHLSLPEDVYLYGGNSSGRAYAEEKNGVSYSHLTLPTKRIV